jgi:hypothetical protein
LDKAEQAEMTRKNQQAMKVNGEWFWFEW